MTGQDLSLARTRTTSATPVAVMWDMDGTLVDTEPGWMRARARLADEHGVAWSDDDAVSFVGRSMTESAERMRARGVDLEPSVLIDRLVRDVLDELQREVPWRPGARELLADLANAGVPCALVTMAYRAVAQFVAAQAHPTAIGAIVAGDDVENGKPSPDAYLKAATALHVDPGDCVAIEDSETGATSAASAGMRVLVVPHLVPVAVGEGRVFRDTLTEVQVKDLAVLTRS